MIRVRLIGEIAVDVDGASIALPEGRPTELLAWLAAHPGRHSRAALAPTFWPEISDKSARASLRTALWGIRKALGDRADSCLLADREALELGGEDLVVDVRRISELRSAGQLAEAVEIADGSLLPGLVSEWADDLRGDHERHLAAMLGELADAAEASGALDEAIAVTRRRVRIEPFDEQVHRRLLARLAAASGGGAVLQEHNAFRRRLWEELRVVPARETTDLVNRLALSSALPEQRPRPLPARLVSIDRQPFVGREPGIDALRQTWRELDEAGLPALCLVSGEPGIGKTRLTARFAAEIAAAGGTALFGATAEDALVAGEPFREAFGLEDLDAPPLVMAAVHDQLTSLTASGPCLVVLDDLHWADTVTLGVLRRVLRAEYADRVLVVATYREMDDRSSRVAVALTELGRECRLERIRLAALDPEETALLFQEVTGAASRDEVAAVVHDRTGGNPLFIVELASSRSGSDLARGDAFEAVPASVHDLVAARVARLSRGAADVLYVGAALGTKIDVALLTATVGDEPVTVDALDELLTVGLLAESGPGVAAFRHDLVREAVYEGLSMARRNRLHQRIAATIAATEGEAEARSRSYELAIHSCAAVPAIEASDAVRATLAAVEHAFATQEYERAVIVLSRAMEIADVEERTRLSIRRAVAYQRLTHQLLDPASL